MSFCDHLGIFSCLVLYFIISDIACHKLNLFTYLRLCVVTLPCATPDRSSPSQRQAPFHVQTPIDCQKCESKLTDTFWFVIKKSTLELMFFIINSSCNSKSSGVAVGVKITNVIECATETESLMP